MMQGDLFGTPDLILRDALIDKDGGTPFFVIGCGRDKLPRPAAASELYVSSRFRNSIALANALGAPFAILSGKHGIADGAEVIEPYDLDLATLSDEDQRRWGEKACNALETRAAGRRITLLATSAYCLPLIQTNRTRQRPLDIVVPWIDLEKPDREVWLVEAHRMVDRIRDLSQLYDWIEAERQSGGMFPFGSLTSESVPKRGVYLFLDRSEPNYRRSGSRVVRIGTHAISAGSRATLRSRLRNHLGPANEIGNHRGSIFRLHVGRAMLDAGPGHHTLRSWGEGQDASVVTKTHEQAHELAVTRYLQQLDVVLLDIDDEPSKDSLRARVEAQLIALFSEGMRPIDLPAPKWLGLESPVAVIKRSGLWNIRGIGEKYDPAAVGSVTSFLRGLNEY